MKIDGIPHVAYQCRDAKETVLWYHLSECMTLMPGNIICTGTPPGVGMGMKPPRFLKVGDEMTLGIEKLGEQRQHVVASSASKK